LDSQGRERRSSGPALANGSGLRFTCKATRERHRETTLRASLRAVDDGSGGLVATYVDASRRVVRREVWLATSTVEVPVQVVRLEGGSAFPHVSAAQAEEAQTWILAQLNGVFADLDVRFRSITAAPVSADGSRYDRDGDRRLSSQEIRLLRDGLEARGIKRRGRVVLVVTSAAFAHGDCRGWTLGDMPASPETLHDPNDNVSVVGLRYLDPSRFHTVAHEVGHQLGLDDINARNARLLREPRRRDHLMVSGGTGLHLDPVVEGILHRATRRFPDHGLEGRQGQPSVGGPVPLPPPPRRGLPQPGLPHPALANPRATSLEASAGR
jgi:hypothetical protein